MQVVLPAKPAPDADEFDVIWQEEYKDKREKLRRLEENKSKAFTLTIGKFSLNVTNKLEGQPECRKVRETINVLGLLKLIQAICCKFESSIKPYWALVMAKKRLNLFFQTKDCFDEKYIERILMLM